MRKIYSAVAFKLRNLKKLGLQIFLANEKSEKMMWVVIRYILNEIYLHESLGSGRPKLKVGINNGGLLDSQKEIGCMFACSPLCVRRT
jgi:hypothetical protein